MSGHFFKINNLAVYCLEILLEKIASLKLNWIEFDDASVQVGTLQSEYVMIKILDYRTIADLSFEISGKITTILVKS